MNILYILNRLSVGGMEKRIAGIATRLAREGYRTGMLCLTEGGELEAPLRKAGIEIFTLDYRGLRTAGPLGLLRTIRAGRRVVREFDADILQAFLPMGNMMANFMAGKNSGTNFVAGKVTTGLFYRKGWPYGLVENWTLGRAARVYCNGNIIKRELVDKCGVDESKVRVIHNGITPQREFSTEERNQARRALRDSLSLPENARLIGMVANLYAYKGHRFVVEASPDIIKAHPNTHFIFVGRDEGEQESLVKQACEMGVENHIHIPGPKSDIPQFLGGLDVFLSASQVEGFSNVWLEGLAASLPCVFTKVGAAAEAFKDGYDCLLIPTDDTDAIRQSLLKILGDDKLAEKLARQGRITITQQYNFDTMVEEFKKLYEEILAESKK